MKITQFDIHTTDDVNEDLRRIISALVNLAIETDMASSEAKKDRVSIRSEILAVVETLEGITMAIKSLEERISSFENTV